MKWVVPINWWWRGAFILLGWAIFLQVFGFSFGDWFLIPAIMLLVVRFDFEVQNFFGWLNSNTEERKNHQ